MEFHLTDDRWTDSLKAVVEAAASLAAQTTQDPWLGTHHLLLALLQTPGEAGPVLHRAGITFQAYLEAVQSTLGGNPSDQDRIVEFQPGAEPVIDRVKPLVEPLIDRESGPDHQVGPIFTPAALEALQGAVNLASGKATELHLLAAVLQTDSVGTGILAMCTPVSIGELRKAAVAQLERRK